MLPLFVPSQKSGSTAAALQMRLRRKFMSARLP